jgi:aminopeptidase N
MAFLNRARLISGLAFFSLFACRQTAVPVKVAKATDHSFGNAHEVRIVHSHIDLVCDFEKKQLKGSVTHRLDSVKGQKLILDTRNLEIGKVWVDGKETHDYQFGVFDTILGTALLIPIDSLSKEVKIAYSTDTAAEALQWLQAGQTHDRKKPFLYTQSQAILARTWIPLMDRPDTRFTYSARIQCPKDLIALMSASNPQQKNDSGIYHFDMPQPVSSYLMALAVGDVQFRALGDACGVYAEPGFLDEVAWELADMAVMIRKAEALYGAYPWGRYDVLVLPPAFPFGGMENPRLTFATPTIIAGDRSLTSLVAHELAHSWSGNLVTNADWNDFWLNEGFTVYFENRIVEAVYGKDIADMQAELEVGELQRTIARLMKEAPDDTRLQLDLSGRNPDEGLTDIAYVKGFLFLKHLENIVGRQRWDQFLRNYFSDYAFGTTTTEAFVQRLNDSLWQSAQEAIRGNANKWIYKPGLPEDWPRPQSTRMATAIAHAAAYLRTGNPDTAATRNWVTQQFQQFLRSLTDTLGPGHLAILDQHFQFTANGNAEIEADWYTLSVKNGYNTAYPAMAAFLQRVGRRKFLLPVYNALAATPEGLEEGRRIFSKARAGYHAVSAGSIARMLKVE